jgi:carbon monoxide dehydrogenase subunit G
MIKISETVIVPAPVEHTWPILSDPAEVVTCVPGMTLTADKGGNVYEGTISVKFGPTTAVFRGQAKVAYDHDAKTCDIEAAGVDQKGSTRATASAHITASGGDTTAIAIDGGFNVTGPLGQFARTGGVFVARALLGDFAANLSERLRVDQPGSPPSSGPPQAPIRREISGFGILGRAVLNWLKHIVGR